ncbi:hypothetical protein [Roseimaritima ulvae]|uniref:Tetratricopeptide repeat protein n=1 Tax=Roseimaritima ulvae TaxID=980254 RepID=A0A5B9QGI0_9BACT|nr:hypothetical protein [Roseimaritima ulvae]QEG38138.1 hypothetical protein UC8_00910 [Roseimaritima ulvae]
MFTTRVMFAAMLSCCCYFAVGDDPFPNGQRQEIVLQEPASTVDEALKRWSAAEAEATKELETAQQAYADRIAAVTQHVVNDLEVIARRKIAAGELAEAFKVWEKVLEMDAENESAKTIFKTIGRMDVLEPKETPVANDIDNRRIWRAASSGEPKFVKQFNGLWIEIRSTGKKRDGPNRRAPHTRLN